MTRSRITFARASLYGFLTLAVASWVYILAGADNGLEDLFSGQAWSNACSFLRQLSGLDAGLSGGGRPAFLDLGRWADTGKLAYKTLLMSVLAISFAGLGVLVTFLPAARNVSNGELGGRPSAGLGALYHLLRLFFAFTRAVPELVWALVIVFFLLPGAIALGLHNYGIVGKLSAEGVENMDPGPARALRSAGAGNLQMLAYGIIPQAMPQFPTYLLYRWEVVIRTTVVVGFVSAGGLGREFRLNLSFFQYTDVALIILWYLILVVAVDLLSALLRRMVRAG